MPKDNNKKKESKEEEASIDIKSREKEQAEINQGNLNKKEPQGKEKGKNGGGLLKDIVNFIKGIFTATIDMPQQEQAGSREKSKIQGQWILNSTINQEIGQVTEKNLKDLSQEIKQKVEKAAEGLKEGLKKSDSGNQSIGIKAPDQTPDEAQEEKSNGKQIS